MEDLWKVRSLDWRLPEMADEAEYQRLLRRYRAEEIQDHMRHLLFPDKGKESQSNR